MSAFDWASSLAVSVFPSIVKVGFVFIDSAVGFPASEVITTLSFHLPCSESISVRRILSPLTGELNDIVDDIVDSPEPDFGSKLIPNELTPPNVLLTTLG